MNTNLTTVTSLNNKIWKSKCKEALCNILNNHIGCKNVIIDEVRYRRTEIEATEASELQWHKKRIWLNYFKIWKSKCKEALCNILNNYTGCRNATIEEVRYKRTKIKATEASELQLYKKRIWLNYLTDESKTHVFS